MMIRLWLIPFSLYLVMRILDINHLMSDTYLTIGYALSVVINFLLVGWALYDYWHEDDEHES